MTQRVNACLALLLFALPALAYGRGDPGLSAAMAALRSGDYRRAVTLYDHVISEFPGTVEAHFQKGFALERLGDNRGAIAEYESTLRLAPKDVRALNNLGFLLVDRVIDVPRGEKLLRKALELSPDFAAAHDSLGWAEYRRKNYAQAEDHFRHALAKDPNNLSAYYHAGVMTLKRGDFTRASLYLRKLVERDPRNVKGLIGLGSAYDHLGQRDQARQTLTRALGLVDRSSSAGQEIVRMLNELGPYYPGASLTRFLNQGTDRTNAMLEPGVRSQGSKPPRSTGQPQVRRDGMPAAAADPAPGPKIDFHRRTGDAEPQPGIANRSPRKLDADLVRRHLELARLYEQNELYKDAESELLTVINLEPSSPEAREARDRIPHVNQQPEVTQEARLGGYLRMGETLFARSAGEEAKLQYQKVLLVDGTHPVANKALSFLYLQAGDLDRALAHVNKALHREPRYLEALLIRGYIEARRRQFDKSCKSFEAVAGLASPTSEVGRYATDMAERMKRFSTLE